MARCSQVATVAIEARRAFYTSHASIAFLIFLISLFASGCGALSRDETTGIYLPPTPAGGVRLLPTPTPTSLPPQVTTLPPTPSCTYNLRYLEDLTIPDSSIVTPGERLDKRWSVENNGSCNWDEGYRLKLTAGPDLGASKEQALYPARSGTQATIRIVFTAPSEPGTYRSAWQAYSPTGQAFGDPIFIEIQVRG